MSILYIISTVCLCLSSLLPVTSSLLPVTSSLLPVTSFSVSVSFWFLLLFMFSSPLSSILSNQLTENWVIGYLLWISRKSSAAFPIQFLTNVDVALSLHPHPPPPPLQLLQAPVIEAPMTPSRPGRCTVCAEQIAAVDPCTACVRSTCNEACVIWIIERCWCSAGPPRRQAAARRCHFSAALALISTTLHILYTHICTHTSVHTHSYQALSALTAANTRALVWTHTGAST